MHTQGHRLREMLREKGVPDEQIEMILSTSGQPPLSMAGSDSMSGGSTPPLSLGAPMAPSSPAAQMGPMGPESPARPPAPSILGGEVLTLGNQESPPVLQLGGNKPAPPAPNLSPYQEQGPVQTDPSASTGSSSLMPEQGRSLTDKIRAKFEEVMNMGRSPPVRPQPKPAPEPLGDERIMPKGMRFAAAEPDERMAIPLLPGQEPEPSRSSRFRPYEPIRGGGMQADNERLNAPISEVDELREPWMKNARREQQQAEIDFQAQRDRLAAARQISEGLGKMQVPVTGEILNRIAPQPFVAEGIRRKEAEWAEKITPQESEFYAAQGIRAPVGMPRTTVLRAVPGLSGLDYKRDYLNWQMAKEGSVQGRFEESQGRLKENQTYKRAQALRAAVNAERSDWLKPTSRIGKIKNQMVEADTIYGLLDDATANPVKTRTAMVKLAKDMAGDTGVLTQQDIDSYKGPTGIPGFFNSLQTFVTGDYTQQQRDMLREALRYLKQKAEEKYAAEAEARIGSFEAANFDTMKEQGVDTEKLRRMLGAPARGGLAPPPETPEAPPAPAGPVSATPAQAGSATGKIRVRRKADGVVGNILPNEWDPNIYEKL